jgi:hypothetical protein
MYLKHKPTSDLVEVLDMPTLIDPCRAQVSGRFHAGEELQEAELFDKGSLCFPSGESLPRCWLDADYKQG